MGARYLKTEEEVIVKCYPTASRDEIIKLIPDRTWGQIGVKARKMGIHRTSKAWGNSTREGRKLHKDAWTDQQNELFDHLYPTQTRMQLLDAFPGKSWFALQTHAQRRHLHRNFAATRRQMQIGKKNARKKKEEEKTMMENGKYITVEEP